MVGEGVVFRLPFMRYGMEKVGLIMESRFMSWSSLETLLSKSKTVFSCLSISVISMAAIIPGALATQFDLNFDKPSQEHYIPLPRNPDNPQANAELRCFSYPNLMVRQIYRGEIGAELALIRNEPGKPVPACKTGATDGEIEIRDYVPFLGELGYFEGKFGNYLIFSAAESTQGATGFWVYSLHGNKLFADLVDATHFDIRSLSITAGKESRKLLQLRYRRVLEAQCSLYSGEAECWRDIRQSTGLKGKAPSCREDYQKYLKSIPATDRRKGRETPSIVEYDVEAIIDRATVSRLAPVSGAIRCFFPE